MDYATRILIEHQYALALKHHNAGRLAEAEQAYRSVIARSPDHVQALHLLGVIHSQKGAYVEAVDMIGRALKGLKRDAGAYNNYGLALMRIGELDEAERALRKAIQIQPNLADACSNLGQLCILKGLFEEAVSLCRKAARLNPELAVAWMNLAEAESSLMNNSVAIDAYRKYLELRPHDPVGYYRLGHVLYTMNRLPESIEVFRQGLHFSPGHVSIAAYASSLLASLNQFEEAERILDDAINCHAADAPERALLCIARLTLPAVPESNEQILACRARYVENLKKLEQGSESQTSVLPSNLPSSFYLAYHEMPDGEIMRSQSRAHRKYFPLLNWKSPYVSEWESPSRTDRKIRVGFLSEFFREHTIAKLTQGFVRNLDRSQFEVCVIHTVDTVRDAACRVFDGLADEVVYLPRDCGQSLRAISDKQLDVLFYSDIGMSPTTYYLAHARLAPVQVLTWGHPDTSGIDTLDYFVTASSLETETSISDYTENVVCLDRLPCYYEPFAAPSSVPGRLAYGLPQDATLYCCPQTLQKMHPDFDQILLGILERDPKAVVVAIEGRPKEWAQMLRLRWQKKSPLLTDRVLFIPGMPLQRFMGLLAHSDVLLDPIYFGSGNTLYEAMVYGTPIVTWPGKFARGRIVAAAYRQMGFSDDEVPVARNAEDYVRLAVELGTQSERRLALRRRLQLAAVDGLYADSLAVRQLEKFFVEAVAAAGRGEKLPTGWRPGE